MARAQGFPGRLVTFGTAPDADVRATRVEDLGVDGMRAEVATAAGTRVLRTPLLGRGNLSNVLAATAVALAFQIPLDEIVSGVEALAPADRRGVVHRLREGVVLVDDSYNSSPSALRAALEVLATSRPGRTVAVLGEMLELGDHAEELHAACGRAAAEAGIGRLIAVGGSPAAALARAAVGAGLPGEAVTYCADSAQAADVVLAAVRPGDLVLVKGSRGIRMDRVTDRLLGERA